MDQFSEVVMFPETTDHSCQYFDVQPSFDFNQPASSHLQVSEASEVSSAFNIKTKGLDLDKVGFLEINDLIDNESTLANVENPVEYLQFEDGLSELDLYQDAEMFLRDLGPIIHETDSHAYTNALVSNNNESQSYQLLSNPEDANKTVGDLWMHGERNTLIRSEEGFVDSCSLSSPGIVNSTRYSVAPLPKNDFTLWFGWRCKLPISFVLSSSQFNALDWHASLCLAGTFLEYKICAILIAFKTQIKFSDLIFPLGKWEPSQFQVSVL